MHRTRRRPRARGGRLPRTRPALELLECRLALAGFTAYNGLFASGSTHPYTTLYADMAGHAAAGPLVDIATGEATSVLLTTSQVGVNFGGTGTNASPGTDAFNIFNQFVDLSAGDTRSIEVEAQDAYQYTFENLDPGATYEFAGTAIRGNPDYTNRWTLIEIQGADSFRAAHTAGPGAFTTNLPANQVALWTGGNSGAGEGYVAQWLDVDPGSDGIFHVVSTQYQGPVPTQINPAGVADGNKGYGLAAIRLIENVAAGPPAVENLPAADIRGVRSHGRRTDHNDRRTGAEREDLLRHERRGHESGSLAACCGRGPSHTQFLAGSGAPAPEHDALLPLLRRELTGQRLGTHQRLVSHPVGESTGRADLTRDEHGCLRVDLGWPGR